jgi:hypothetical protein
MKNIKNLKILSWIPIVGAFVAEDALIFEIFTKKVYIFCRIYHFIILFVIGWFIGKLF